MTEQFAVQLRQHLIEAADDRPEEGRLEAVVQRTAVLPQRMPWAARLRWRIDPIAPLENVWLRYGLVATALLIAAVVLAVLSSVGHANAGTVFEGTWTSADPIDRSTQTLVVEAGQAPAVHFEDDFSVNCQRRGDTSTLYVADGPSEIVGDRLTAHYASGGCIKRIAPYDAFYDYDPATDTLLDYQAIRWVRQELASPASP
jgi:hypothetical protein